MIWVFRWKFIAFVTNNAPNALLAIYNFLYTCLGSQVYGVSDVNGGHRFSFMYGVYKIRISALDSIQIVVGTMG